MSHPAPSIRTQQTYRLFQSGLWRTPALWLEEDSEELVSIKKTTLKKQKKNKIKNQRSSQSMLFWVIDCNRQKRGGGLTVGLTRHMVLLTDVQLSHLLHDVDDLYHWLK